MLSTYLILQMEHIDTGYENVARNENRPGVAQFGSALDLGSRGRGFESRYPD